MARPLGAADFALLTGLPRATVLHRYHRLMDGRDPATVSRRAVLAALMQAADRRVTLMLPLPGGQTLQSGVRAVILQVRADPALRLARPEQLGASITPDLAWLPKDVAAGADYTLVLPPLTGPDMLAVAEALAGDPPTETMSDEEAAAPAPRLLRLARRPSQTADAYVRKLKRLLALQATEAEVTEPPSVTVREGPSSAGCTATLSNYNPTWIMSLPRLDCPL